MIQRNILRSANAALRSQSSFAPLRAARPAGFTARVMPMPSQRAAARWYSDAPAAKEGEAAKEEEAKPSETKPSEADELKATVEKKDKEILDWKDKYLRSVADFRNLQDRTKREVQAAKDFALQRFARDLVESVDNLDRALITVPAESLNAENKDLVTLHDGLKMTESILMSTLKKHGLERFDPSTEGMKFDPNIHEAVFQTPQPDKEDGTVFHTQQKGFLLNGRVLRAAKVGVVKNS
ncbi:mitochondrial co-chaperone-like protein GrpE [Mytilinidion resinicola]|uniref:GrpE protein homolog n=1 Tax=Mytilinidion resinicola TaxID=574789 RepID=A0A6A6YLE9_9PEZI|nr:mitochondrial co-chaperone-like protein GrpE [Mytilinidion resinicola]KAF2808697.1 mitochondrial co-chaperone-like protein GrpE [Mytilinidion resinicola]